MHFQEIIKQLPLPWSNWLKEAKLLPPVDGTALLVVPESTVDMYRALEFISQVLGIARQLYAETQSIIIVSGLVYDLVGTGELEVTNIKID